MRPRRVLEAFLSRLPLRALRERRQGKAHALNLATAEATGDFILSTDDDVLVNRRWLAAYDAAIQRWPDAALFGGPIEPLFTGTPPWWLARVLFPDSWAASAYGRLMRGEEALPLSTELTPYGANMAVRRELQRQFPYDSSRGPRGSRYAVGEDTDMATAVAAGGSHRLVRPGRVGAARGPPLAPNDRAFAPLRPRLRRVARRPGRPLPGCAKVVW